MPVNSPNPERSLPPTAVLLGIDTCGPSGSVALGRLAGGAVEILEQIELEGRSYSSTLVAAVAELLTRHSVGLRDLGCIVAVRGPGSFTGVRVGLSAVKGLAEAAGLPVVALSRLEVLAVTAGVPSAALDAHRHEVFLRIGESGAEARELLAGAQELAQVNPVPLRIALCDESAEALLASTWPATEIVQSRPPTAADALSLALPRIVAGEFVDLALLDGHYLRRSDAEIFGEVAAVAKEPMNSDAQILVRPMCEADLERVVDLAQSLKEAPHWPRGAYVAALDLDALPRRIARVAEEVELGEVKGFAVASLMPPQAELESIGVAAQSQRRGLARRLFADLVRELQLQGITEIILEVRASNHPALQFYRALGFVETARRPRYYTDPVEDAALFTLRVGR